MLVEKCFFVDLMLHFWSKNIRFGFSVKIVSDSGPKKNYYLIRGICYFTVKLWLAMAL